MSNDRKRLYAVRGASCTENTADAIVANTCAMCSEIFEKNRIVPDDIVSIQFTVTDDLDALNPAAALRRGNCGIDVSRCALFCAVEPKVKGSLPKTVRVMVTAYLPDGSIPVHAYCNGAEVLRPDFVRKNKA